LLSKEKEDIRMIKILYAIIILLLISSGAEAHTVHYQVENKGISVRVFYAEDDPASYSSYEIFGPGDKIPHQKGWTDKNGFVSFLPDKQGKWIIKVYGESEHGMHGAQVEIDVNKNLFMESFKKPLVAQYTKAFVGISFILAIFGLWALLRTRKREVTEDGSKPSGAP
jgi:nickel transport protein